MKQKEKTDHRFFHVALGLFCLGLDFRVFGYIWIAYNGYTFFASMCEGATKKEDREKNKNIHDSAELKLKRITCAEHKCYFLFWNNEEDAHESIQFTFAFNKFVILGFIAAIF